MGVAFYRLVVILFFLISTVCSSLAGRENCLGNYCPITVTDFESSEIIFHYRYSLPRCLTQFEKQLQCRMFLAFSLGTLALQLAKPDRIRFGANKRQFCYVKLDLCRSMSSPEKTCVWPSSLEKLCTHETQPRQSTLCLLGNTSLADKKLCFPP